MTLLLSILAVTAAAFGGVAYAQTTSLYIPLATATTHTLSAEAIGVDKSGHTTWVIHQSLPTLIAGTAATIVEGASEVFLPVYNIDPNALPNTVLATHSMACKFSGQQSECEIDEGSGATLTITETPHFVPIQVEKPTTAGTTSLNAPIISLMGVMLGAVMVFLRV